MRTRVNQSAAFIFAVSLTLLLTSCSSTPSLVREQPDAALQQKLDGLVKGFKGDVGIYVHNLKTGQTAAVQPDSLFPTASMIKMSILCGVFDKINKGELKYNQELLYRDSLKYDDGVTGSFRDSTKIELAELVTLMITLSDNTASLWLQQLAGGGATINAWLENNGFHQIRVNSRTPGRQAMREVYGWGVASPREMAKLITYIYQGHAVSPSASEQMFRVLSRQFWDGEGLSQIPPTVHVATKNGAVDASKSETVLVNAPSGDYVYCVMTKNQQDQRWEDDNEGNVMLRKIARMLWEYFEPESIWKPQPASGTWTK
jgi:beta-lactamase class A